MSPQREGMNSQQATVLPFAPIALSRDQAVDAACCSPIQGMACKPAAHGYQVLHPRTLYIKDQIELWRIRKLMNRARQVQVRIGKGSVPSPDGQFLPGAIPRPCKTHLYRHRG